MENELKFIDRWTKETETKTEEKKTILILCECVFYVVVKRFHVHHESTSFRALASAKVSLAEHFSCSASQLHHVLQAICTRCTKKNRQKKPFLSTETKTEDMVSRWVCVFRYVSFVASIQIFIYSAYVWNYMSNDGKTQVMLFLTKWQILVCIRFKLALWSPLLRLLLLLLRRCRLRCII